MTEPEKKGFLDHAVELLARLMDALGQNGTRLRWRWNQRRLQMAESGQRAAHLWRSARGRHKMCPSCRALVPRLARSCPQCGAGLVGVRAPGLSRMISNLLPGTTASTSMILLVNGILFLMMLLTNLRDPGEAQGLGRLIGFDLFTVYRYGASHGWLAAHDGEWWRLVTGIFLHGGLIHFGFNTYVLMQLGPLVESEYGTERFWVIYLTSGLVGNLAVALLQPRVPVVGASGAIVGLVGLLIAYGSRIGTVGGQALRRTMIRYAIFILIISLLPGISLLAHAGGFVAGLVLGWIVPTGRFRSRATARTWQLLSLAGVVLVLFCFYQVSVHGTDFQQYWG